MSKKILILILLCGLFFLSCVKDKELELKPEPEPEPTCSIIGKWIWFGSWNGWGSDSPESTGITISINFVSDDSVFVFDNLDTVLKAEYFIRKEASYTTNKEEDFLHIISDTVYSTNPTVFIIAPCSPFDRFIIKLFPDTLYLREDCCDCAGHGFKRAIK